MQPFLSSIKSWLEMVCREKSERARVRVSEEWRGSLEPPLGFKRLEVEDSEMFVVVFVDRGERAKGEVFNFGLLVYELSHTLPLIYIQS
jgi:hypothetical protein